MKTGQDSFVAKPNSNDRENNASLKQALVLTMAIFFMSAPALDSNDIADISANFIVLANHSASTPLKTIE